MSENELEKPPEIIWLQWYDENEMFEWEEEPEWDLLNTGLIVAHPEERTWCSDPVGNHTDAPTIPIAYMDRRYTDVGPYIHTDAAEAKQKEENGFLFRSNTVLQKRIAELEAENEKLKFSINYVCKKCGAGVSYDGDGDYIHHYAPGGITEGHAPVPEVYNCE